MTAPGPTVTCMSGWSTRLWGRTRDICPLARRWLSTGLVAMFLVGCLFPEPPDYRRQRTPPFLWSPIPSTTEVLAVESGDVLNLNVNVTSEDDGEDLVASLYLNYLIDGVAPQAERERLVPAGTLAQDATEYRQIAISWIVPERSRPGTCEQLSLVVTHVGNLDRERQYRPISDADVGVVTWWLDINESDKTIGQCPRRVGSGP